MSIIIPIIIGLAVGLGSRLLLELVPLSWGTFDCHRGGDS